MRIGKDQRKLNDLINDLKGVETGELRQKFKYKSKEHADSIDWTSYNQAQFEELDNQLILIRNMVDEAANALGDAVEPSGREGRPAKKASDKAKALLIQQYFMATDRFAAGLVWFLREKLGITERLTPKDIERAYDDSDVIAMLMEVLRMSNEPVKGIDNKFTIDGTGMPTSIKQNYASDKTDDAKRAVYDMLIGMVGVRTKLFSAFAVAGPGGESPHLPPVLEETASIYTNIDCVMADAGYIGRDNCDAISEAGAVPYIFPAQRITLSQKGSMTWKHMLLALVHDPQKWLEEYHLRSISESVNSVWKRKYTRPLARKTRERRTVEALGRIICYNMRRLSYLHILDNIHVPWLMTG